MKFLLSIGLLLVGINTAQSQFRMTSPALFPQESQFIESRLTLTDNQVPDLNLFGNLGNNIVNSFKGGNLYLHLAGIASTVLIVTTNTDYHVHKFFYEHEGYGEAAMPVIRAGMFIPFVTGGSLYAYGKLKKDDRAVAASFAVLQSSLIAFLYNPY